MSIYNPALDPRSMYQENLAIVLQQKIEKNRAINQAATVMKRLFRPFRIARFFEKQTLGIANKTTL
jgi:hypothetical protein